MAWGPKPKLITEMNRSITIGEKTYHLTVRKTSCKRPQRSPYGETLKGKWVETVSTNGYCNEFPNVHWWPYIDFGDRSVQYSCDGWEMMAPEFSCLQEIIEAMIFEVKEWE